MVRACRICGKWFDATSKNNTLCSAECREIAKTERSRISRRNRNQRKKLKKTNNAKKIIDLNAEAKAMGMSYGKYVAYLSMKEGK
jgi:predicted nucleic acid-binding Zn ribbon protein